MKQSIIGREYEFELLNRAMQSDESELIVVYGRRRVGKTFLVNQFFNNKYTFKLTGVYNKPTEVQLERFASQMELFSGSSIETPANWYKAFDVLRKYILGTQKDEKKIIFIDEMPWLDTENSYSLPIIDCFIVLPILWLQR